MAPRACRIANFLCVSVLWRSYTALDACFVLRNGVPRPSGGSLDVQVATTSSHSFFFWMAVNHKSCPLMLSRRQASVPCFRSRQFAQVMATRIPKPFEHASSPSGYASRLMGASSYFRLTTLRPTSGCGTSEGRGRPKSGAWRTASCPLHSLTPSGLDMYIVRAATPWLPLPSRQHVCTMSQFQIRVGPLQHNMIPCMLRWHFLICLVPSAVTCNMNVRQYVVVNRCQINVLTEL